MTVEVTLEVEVGQLLRLRHLQELAERAIRRDVVLVLQVLLLDVVVDLLCDVGAADQGALGVTEEHAELVRHLRGDLEDARATRLGTLLTLGTDATLTLAGILDLAVDTLVQTLDLRDHQAHRLAERREGREDALEVLIERRRRGLSDGRGRRNRCSDNRGHNRRGSLLRRRLAARLLGLYRGRGRRRKHLRGSGNRDNNLLSLLRNRLLSNRLSRGGTHHTSSVGRIHGK